MGTPRITGVSREAMYPETFQSELYAPYLPTYLLLLLRLLLLRLLLLKLSEFTRLVSLPARAKYPVFNQATAEFEASERCRKLSLPMHMLAIIQRLPKYILLLTQYKKYIQDKEYPDNTEIVKHGSSFIPRNRSKYMTMALTS